MHIISKMKVKYFNKINGKKGFTTKAYIILKGYIIYVYTNLIKSLSTIFKNVFSNIENIWLKICLKYKRRMQSSIIMKLQKHTPKHKHTWKHTQRHTHIHIITHKKHTQPLTQYTEISRLQFNYIFKKKRL